MRRGCYPGSFDPLTVGHLAVADAAFAQCHLDGLDLVISEVALGKSSHHHPLEERVALIERTTLDRPWLRVVVTHHRLLADIAEGYDVLVVGADKWVQVLDPAFYGSVELRDEALARLPATVAWAPRGDLPAPAGVTVLDVPAWARDVSSTAVRAGAHHWRAAPGPKTRRSPE